MASARQARADRRELMKQIAKDHRAKARAKVKELHAAIGAAREARKAGIAAARCSCKTARLAARARAQDLRTRALLELKEAVRLERDAARTSCAAAKNDARSKTPIQAARAAHAAERQFQRDMKRIEASNRSRMKEHKRKTKAEARGESDGEVIANIPPELVDLFRRVRRGIKGSARMTRTEAFLKYAEENASEVYEALDDKTDQLIADLQRQQKKARKAASSSSVVPF